MLLLFLFLIDTLFLSALEESILDILTRGLPCCHCRFWQCFLDLLHALTLLGFGCGSDRGGLSWSCRTLSQSWNPRNSYSFLTFLSWLILLIFRLGPLFFPFLSVFKDPSRRSTHLGGFCQFPCLFVHLINGFHVPLPLLFHEVLLFLQEALLTFFSFALLLVNVLGQVSHWRGIHCRVAHWFLFACHQLRSECAALQLVLLAL